MLILIKLGIIYIVTCLLMYYAVRVALTKKWYQPIYHLSPITHQNKQNTPSIGGLVIVVSIIIGSGLCGILGFFEVRWLLLIMFMFALIGAIDDVIAILFQRNKGLTAKQKFMLQVIFSIIIMVIWSYYKGGLSVFMGLFYSIVMTGASNATNLTDGLDGLLGGSMIVSLLGMLVMGWMIFPIHILVFIGIVISVVLAFLVFNIHPAKVFMGDTGALMMGALLAGLAVLFGNIWVLLPIGLIYIVETLSVILQVVWFKKTQSRLFLMAPLHHHFEKMGMVESHVVYLFWIMGSIGVLVGLVCFYVM